MNNAPSLDRIKQKFTKTAVASGIVLACCSAISPGRVWLNLHLGALYLLTIMLGASVFLALACVTGAGWHTAFRRVPEAMARLIPLFGMSLLAVIGTNLSRFHWHHYGHGDTGTFWFKEYWLDSSFLMIRSCFYVAIWSFFSAKLAGLSKKQDLSGEVSLSVAAVRYSAIYLALFAVSFSLAVVDWIMSLEPMWFSTIWGIYQFAGMFQASLAAMILFCITLESRKGPLQEIFNTEHLHDLAKLLLGFSCFWMYIWFCQYMLIWYSNIPEETSYFIIRTQGAWGPVVVASLLLNGILPFFMLLSRPAKRSRSIMTKIAVVVLIGRWIDLYIMIFPSTFQSGPVIGPWEVVSPLFLLGVTFVFVLQKFTRAPPFPSKDPFLPESLHYHAS